MNEQEDQSEFEAESNKRRHGIVAECWNYLFDSKKWWLMPIVLVFLLLGLFVVLTATGAGPLIYTLF